MNDALIVLNLIYASVRKESPVSCVNPYVVINNIVELSKKYEYCYMINDSHNRGDNELKYLPPHALDFSIDSTIIVNFWNKINSRVKTALFKKTQDAIQNEHIKKLILDKHHSEICVTGFSTSLDILPTVLGLKQYHPNVVIKDDCTSDLTEEHKLKAIEYMKWIGVKECG
jgi:nicotinamidase-related amidase